MRYFFVADHRKLPISPSETIPLFEDNCDNVRGACLAAEEEADGGELIANTVGAVELTRDVYVAMAKAAQTNESLS